MAVAVDQLVMRRPPDLEIGRRSDLPQHPMRDGSPDGRVQVWRDPFLWFDGGEVLHIPADAAAQVLPPAILEPREVHRPPRRPPVVIRRWIHRRPVIAAPP